MASRRNTRASCVCRACAATPRPPLGRLARWDQRSSSPCLSRMDHILRWFSGSLRCLAAGRIRAANSRPTAGDPPAGRSHGKSEWNVADNLRDLADPVPDLAGHIAGRRYARLDLRLLRREDLGNDRLGVLAQLTGGRSLAHMVAALRKAAEWLRGGDAEDHSLFGAYQDWVRVLLPQLELPVPEPDTEVVLEWRDLMDGFDGIGSACARMAPGVASTGPRGRPARVVESTGLAPVRRGDRGGAGRRVNRQRPCPPRGGGRPHPGLRNRQRVARPRSTVSPPRRRPTPNHPSSDHGGVNHGEWSRCTGILRGPAATAQ